MKTLTTFVAAAALVAGGAGAAVAYQGASTRSNVDVPVSAPAPTTAARTVPRPAVVQVRFHPCKPPAHREGRRCVVHVTRTVVAPGATTAPGAATATTTPTAAGARAGERGETRAMERREPRQEPGEVQHDD